MFKFLKKKSASENTSVPCLALDIGTEYVKALICKTDPLQKKVEVFGVGRQKQNLGDTQAGTILDIANVINNCEMAIAEAEKMAGFRPKQMIMGIGGELIKGKSTTVNYTREDAEKSIDINELKNIVHKAQWQAFEKVRNELAVETGHEEIEVKLVNAVITKVNIDGQCVTNPVGFQGKKLKLQIFNSFAPLTHYGSLQTVAAELEYDLLAIIAQPYALSRCLTDEDGGDLSAIFVDIGGGTTDVAVVEAGSIIGMKMYGLGGRTFTKRLSANLNLSFREAERIKQAYVGRELERSSEKIVAENLETDIAVWLKGIELSLAEFGQETPLPSRILLCGGGGMLPEIMSALENKTWQKKVNFTRSPRISILEAKDITTIKDVTGSLTTQQFITPLALANLTTEFVGNEEVVQKIMRNMLNIIQR